MSRPSWHRQAGLEAAVNAVRPDLDHEVRVDMMLGIALALPGHHMTYPTDPETWRARCAPHIIISSSRVDVLQMRSSSTCLSSSDRGATRGECYYEGMAKPCRHAFIHQREGGRGLNQALTVH